MGEQYHYIEPLNDYYEEEDVSEFFDSHFAAFTLDGAQYAFPYVTDPMSILYRTDIFEDNGITPNVDWTWDEYMDTAEKLTKGDIYGASISGINHQQAVHFMDRYWGLGGRFFSSEWEATLDNPKTIEALEMLKGLFDYAPPEAKAADIGELYNIFASGNCAMMESWLTLSKAMLDDPEQSNIVGKFSVLPKPGTGPIYNALWALGVSKDSKNKEAAFEWIKFYTSKKSQLHNWENFGMPPTRESIWLDSSFTSDKPWAEGYISGLRRGVVTWRLPAEPEIWDIVQEEVDRYLKDMITADECAKNIQQRVAESIANNPPEEGYPNIEDTF
jgi:ABC-type glycerol-3-phosphate transport system substrate-binding protein